MSHIRRAMQIHRHLSAHQARNAPLYRMIDTMATGIFLLDGTGTVRHANPAAEKVLRDNAAIRMNAKGALSLAKPDKQAEFANLLRGATATGLRERASTDEGRLPPGGVLGLADGPGELPLMMTVTPLSAMSGYEDLASDGIAAGVFVTDPAAPRLLARGLLMRNFLLNSRECDICEAFVNFPSPEAIADQLGLTISTVRGYFKAIYAKTGRHSQAELMRLLMGVVVEFEHVR